MKTPCLVGLEPKIIVKMHKNKIEKLQKFNEYTDGIAKPLARVVRKWYNSIGTTNSIKER